MLRFSLFVGIAARWSISQVSDGKLILVYFLERFPDGAGGQLLLIFQVPSHSKLSPRLTTSFVTPKHTFIIHALCFNKKTISPENA